MTEKELHKLRRQDLLQMLVAQGREVTRRKVAAEELENSLRLSEESNERLKHRLDEKDETIEKLKHRLDEKDETMEKLKKRLDEKDALIRKLFGEDIAALSRVVDIAKSQGAGE